ncbi:MAG: hypothetical protein WBA28_01680 [Microbacteriaceae bacterium]
MLGDDAEAIAESFSASAQQLERALARLLRVHVSLNWEGVAAEAYRQEFSAIRIRGARVLDELRHLGQN